ncbi:hypothetical protein LOC54_02440 [Acetobacter sp. AN02]|uniref:hypothetical protein n=1 Tax=Acetobacter sp. AN02 TaxID=2894186 RepID=UPI00243418D9|nr:hypothetical protein [Acetobacter sp. AN02]MDG6093981.1 hypothetical protein [Acetobacter sp. AN02]
MGEADGYFCLAGAHGFHGVVDVAQGDEGLVMHVCRDGHEFYVRDGGERFLAAFR